MSRRGEKKLEKTRNFPSDCPMTPPKLYLILIMVFQKIKKYTRQYRVNFLPYSFDVYLNFLPYLCRVSCQQNIFLNYCNFNVTFIIIIITLNIYQYDDYPYIFIIGSLFNIILLHEYPTRQQTYGSSRPG